jgi:predicted CoA-binding protein
VNIVHEFHGRDLHPSLPAIAGHARRAGIWKILILLNSNIGGKMNQAVKDFIQAKRVAVVGVSRDPKKFGSIAATELKQRGYQVFLVHPEAKEIGGDPCYASLAALKGQVDSVLICVSSQYAGAVLRDAAAAGIQRIWLQNGAESPEVLALAKELGMDPVCKKCVLMYASPTGKVGGMHGFHGTIMKLVGQY